MAPLTRLLGACALLLSHVPLVKSQTVVPAPIVVPPSQNWDGPDGPWSTFHVRLGNPPQVVRVLVSTLSPVTYAVLEYPDCESLSQCSDLRGGVFNNNESTTWNQVGIFNLAIEESLGYTGNGLYGKDTVGLGLTASDGPTLNDSVVSAFITNKFDVGFFGLSIQPTNFSNFNNPIPSFFQTLRTKKMIPSLSYSYTAGNKYNLKGVLGNFIFGGYDASRFAPNDLSFQFAPDSTRDLVVGIQSIQSTTSNGRTTNLLSEGVLAFIDSTVSEIYLPLDACELFENAFGLEWDDVQKIYPVSRSLDSALKAQNPNFTFTLGNSVSGGNTVQITLPYSAFALQATVPYVNASTQYFPLKRADNQTQYTLGRTFLQEAYLTADYERQNFSISQCVYSDSPPNVHIIHSLDYVAPPSSNSTDGSSGSSGSSSGVSTGAIAGIAAGVAVLAIVGGYLLFAWCTKRRPFKRLASSNNVELDSASIGHEADSHALPLKGALPSNVHEADADPKHGFYGNELPGSRGDPSKYKNELPGAHVPGVYRPGDNLSHGELGGSEAAQELPTSTNPGFLFEMPGSDVPDDYLVSTYSNSASRAGSMSQGVSNPTSRAASLRNEARRRNASANSQLPPTPPMPGSSQTRGNDNYNYNNNNNNNQSNGASTLSPTSPSDSSTIVVSPNTPGTRSPPPLPPIPGSSTRSRGRPNDNGGRGSNARTASSGISPSGDFDAEDSYLMSPMTPEESVASRRHPVSAEPSRSRSRARKSRYREGNDPFNDGAGQGGGAGDYAV